MDCFKYKILKSVLNICLIYILCTWYLDKKNHHHRLYLCVMSKAYKYFAWNKEAVIIWSSKYKKVANDGMCLPFDPPPPPPR